MQNVQTPPTAQLQSPADDRALAEAIRERDERALSTIYDRYVAQLLGLTSRILPERSEAEEVVLDVFTRLWRRPDGFDPRRGTLRVYLMVMTRSLALDRVRARRRRLAMEERAAAQDESGIATPLPIPQPADQLLQKNRLGSRLHAALATLGEGQRRAISMAYFEGYTQSEIAAALGVPLGTIKTRIRDGMKRLRAQLSRIGEEVPR